MIATKQAARQTTRRNGRKAEAHGQFVAQRQEAGAWVTVIDEKYENDHHRGNLLRAYSEWVNNAPWGDVRRAVEHCTVDGKARHIIRAESMTGQPDGEAEFPEHDAEALRQFLADQTGLAWRVYNVQGVDYCEPVIQ